jgi:C1A family cysteine protease
MGSYLSTPTEKTTTVPVNGHTRVLNVKRSKYSSQTKYLKINKTCLNANPIAPIDLSQSAKCYPVFDQQKLGSCTANGICGAYWFDILNGKSTEAVDPHFVPSRLYLYYKERAMEGNVGTDAGANIADGITVLRTTGVCSEAKYPYLIEKFADQPPAECDEEAKKHHSVTDRRVNQTLEDIYACLKAGFPVVFGFDVYKAFESIGADGLVAMPADGEEMLGGHCVIIMGYDPEKQLFKVMNSWGPEWADKGFCYFPKDYILGDKLAYDFTVVTQIVDETELLNRIHATDRPSYKNILLKKN